MKKLSVIFESFDNSNNIKWDEATNKLNAYQIANEYGNKELIELILHYDVDYIKANHKDLAKGIQDSKKLTTPQKYKLGMDMLDRLGMLSDAEREHMISHFHKINNDKAPEEGGFKY